MKTQQQPLLPQDHKPLLTVKTLKNWVLPPRPKNARKSKNNERKSFSSASSPSASSPSSVPSPPQTQVPQKQHPIEPKNDSRTCDSELSGSIKKVDEENYHLKVKLLSLINDYKRIKTHLAKSQEDAELPCLVDSSCNSTRKRSYIEVDPMNELISNMNDLSYKSPPELDTLDECPSTPYIDDLLSLPDSAPGEEAASAELFSFVKLDNELEKAIPDEEIDDEELDSALLSRSTSPGCFETDGESPLTNSLTRSTTVSTNNSSIPEKKHSMPSMMNFYDLPSYSEQDYGFTFEDINPHDKMLSVIEEDHYNQVADFLAEKLLSNDVKYYVDKATDEPTLI